MDSPNPLYHLLKAKQADLTVDEAYSPLAQREWVHWLHDKLWATLVWVNFFILLGSATLVPNAIWGGRFEPVFDLWGQHPAIDQLNGWARLSPYFDGAQLWIAAYGIVAGAFYQVVTVLVHKTWGMPRYALLHDTVPDDLMFHAATAAGYSVLFLSALTFIFGERDQSIAAYVLAASGVLAIFIPHIGRGPVFSGYKVDRAARSTTEQSTQAQKNTGEDDEVPVRPEPPQIDFSHIFGMEELKGRLLTAGQEILAERQKGEAPRNGVLLHGEPGNGKTVFAEALAGELGVPIIKLTYGDLSSEWLGKMPRLIKKTFAYAKRCAPCVLMVDEIDAFLRSRDEGGQHEENRKVTNTLLTEIVELRRHKIILVGATNFLEAIDAAAAREGRFDYKIEVTPPDLEARLKLIRQGVAKHASGLTFEDADLVSVAERWNGFSVSRLMAICQALKEVAETTQHFHIEYPQWVAALRLVQGAARGLTGQIRPLDQLIMDDNNSRILNGMVQRLKNAVDVERLGGELPHGVLFAGPPGTGKTAAAKAIAKASDWSFISVAGPDLLADRGKMQKVFEQAKNLRPAIIFVDEGDDVLRDRTYSNHSELVNKLLTLMDGTAEKVRDVLWVAATNHPDQIDPALLRAGRFTEKVVFTLPPSDLVPTHIEAWLGRKKVTFNDGVTKTGFASKAAVLLADQTVANIEGVLQQALNMAIADGNIKANAVTIELKHIKMAMPLVLGQD